MAGLWAISLGIDPRFPTFSLNSVQELSAARALIQFSQESVDLVLGRLVGPSMGFLCWSTVEWTVERGPAAPPRVQKASSAQHSPLLSTVSWNTLVLLSLL